MEDEELKAKKRRDELAEQFVGRCDSCSEPIYSYQTRYLVTIGKKDFEICPCCCIRVVGEPKYKTNGLCIHNYSDEEMADFLTWVQQDAYAYGAVEGYGDTVYPNTFAGWLKWFGEEES